MSVQMPPSEDTTHFPLLDPLLPLLGTQRATLVAVELRGARLERTKTHLKQAWKMPIRFVE